MPESIINAPIKVSEAEVHPAQPIQPEPATPGPAGPEPIILQPKAGVKSSEFYLTASVDLVAAIVAILVARGLMSEAEAPMWSNLARAALVVVLPLVACLTTVRYTQARTDLKLAAGEKKAGEGAATRGDPGGDSLIEEVHG